MATIEELITDLPREKLKELVRLIRQRLGGSSRVKGGEHRVIRARGIDATIGVCGGAARIVRTRIPVWTLEQMRRLGLSEGMILQSYPTLRAEDLVNAWAYVDSHRSEIDDQIRQNELD